ncbi:MAG: hypothetical protein Q4B70_15005 [Lachnospiraceae bacterium]|nr:hypothetical protein [Lachnospiraceae bacterium]
MAAIYFLIAQVVVFLFFYPMLLVGKQADEELRVLFEKRFPEEERKELEDKMESQREVVRTIEKEIRKGSAPVSFDGFGFSEDTYHLVESQAKLNQLLDYFFRNGDYASLADRQIKSNIYMDAAGKKLNFRPAKSEMDRRRMEHSAKQWIKKKHPSFDGDVYVENVRCFLELDKKEVEKRKCVVDGEQTTALIFSRKHLMALYLQCLTHRKEAMQTREHLEGLSETYNRIYRLENVDVLFQCLLLDQMEWEGERLYVQLSTVFLLKQEGFQAQDG